MSAEILKKIDEINQKAMKIADENAKLKAENETLKSASIYKDGQAPNVFTSNVNSFERKTMEAFRVNTPQQLLTLNTSHANYKHVPVEFKENVKQLKNDLFVARAIQQMFYGGQRDVFAEAVEEDRIANLKGIYDSYFGKEVLAGKIKAFSTSGDGSAWIPTAISNEYIEEYQLALEVANLFQIIDMPTNPYKMPIQTSKTKARKATEGGQASGTSFTTSNLSFSATKIYEYYPITEEITEDSAPNLLTLARKEVINSQIRAIEDAILNGDISATHMDSDTHALGADVSGKFWKGLRKMALANSVNGSTPSNSGASISDAFMSEIESAMGKFSVKPNEMAWILSTNAYNTIRTLTKVATVEKFGPLATILRGALASYDGRPIVISEFGRDDLNASGVYDGTTKTNCSILGVNTTRMFLGRRRPMRVRVEQDRADYDRTLVASYGRYDFTGFAQGADEVSVAAAINVIP